MRMLLIALMGWMLLHANVTMDAASAACRLFVTSVLPGLFPYMVLSLMLTSRFPGRMPEWVHLLLSWGGGSPTGARLLAFQQGRSRRALVRLAVSCATMSPMFLLGTLGGWLKSPLAGAVLLVSVIAGGWLTGIAAGLCAKETSGAACREERKCRPLSLGEAVEQSARTMLLVCGTMSMLRVLAALSVRGLPQMALPLTTFLEVTTGAQAIALLPLPLPVRTAILAGAAGFGGAASLMQNRTMYPPGLLSLPVQTAWQLLHGAISFLIALGVMQLLPG